MDRIWRWPLAVASLSLGGLLTAAAEGSDPSPTKTNKLWYLVEMGPEPDFRVPFFVGIPKDRTTGTAELRDFQTHPSAEFRREGDEIRLRWPLYRTEIQFSLAGKNMGQGRFTRAEGFLQSESMPLSARTVPAPTRSQLRTALGRPASRPRLAKKWRGRWRCDASTSKEVKPLSIVPSGEQIAASMGTAWGDVNDIALAHQFGSASATLWRFDGQFSYRFDLRAQSDGTLAGTLRSGAEPAEAIRCRRDPSKARPPLHLAKGLRPTALGRRAFRLPDGQPALVALGATWCPTCIESTPHLKKLHQQYGQRGLAFRSMYFEETGDATADRAQTTAYAKKAGVAWPLFPSPVSFDQMQTLFPDELDFHAYNIKGIPHFIVLDATGHIEVLHAGFARPDLPGEHARWRRAVEGAIQRVLTKPGKATTKLTTP